MARLDKRHRSSQPATTAAGKPTANDEVMDRVPLAAFTIELKPGDDDCFYHVVIDGLRKAELTAWNTSPHDLRRMAYSWCHSREARRARARSTASRAAVGASSARSFSAGCFPQSACST